MRKVVAAMIGHNCIRCWSRSRPPSSGSRASSLRVVELSGPQDLQIDCNHFPSARRQPVSGFEGEQQQQPPSSCYTLFILKKRTLIITMCFPLRVHSF